MPAKYFFSTKPKIEEKKFILTLTITRDCNLRCLYCYEPSRDRKGTINLEKAKDVITYFMECDNGSDNVEIQLFGGEPMLEFALIQEIVDWFHLRTWKKGHTFFICTNGTILTEEMKTWLLRHKDCVVMGFSIDGNQIAHDIGRGNSYKLLKRNLPFFTETWPNQPAKMTVTAETIPYVADSVIQLEEMGMYFTANIVFEDIWGSPDSKHRLLEIYKEQLERLVDFYASRPDLEPVEPMLQRELGIIGVDQLRSGTGDDCVRYCGAGHQMAMVDIDGTIHPCHRFSPWVAKRPAPESGANRQNQWKPEQCAACRFLSLCPTCAGFNWEVNGDSGIRTTYHCEAFKLELAATAKLQALRLSQRQLAELKEMSREDVFLVQKRIATILDLAGKEI